MPQTPDRRPGVSDEEGVNLEESPDGFAGAPGHFRFKSGRFSMCDSAGEFDPRTGGGGITEAQHKVLRQLIHFIDDGPAEGFPSGCYKETTPTGPFPTSEIWWESSSKLKKIVSLDTAWTGVNITQEVWKVYDTDGTVLATVTDTISYSGIFETSRNRTIA